MSIVNIKVKKSYLKIFCVYKIDGKEIQLKSTKENIFTYSLETTQPEIRLEIFSFHEMSSKHWFLFAVLFFIISIFGIFNKRYDKTCRSVKYSAVIPLKNDVTNLELAFQSFTEGAPAIEAQGDCSGYQQEENLFYIDEDIKKKLKQFKIFKILFWIS